MDLTSVPGIGPAYARRLREAGIRRVRDLAALDDVTRVAERTEIPATRLEAFRDEARALAGTPTTDEPDLGIATEGVSHELGENAVKAREALRQAWSDVRLVAREKWMEMREQAEDITHRLPLRRGDDHA